MDEENDLGGSPLALIAGLGQTYTTPEAQKIAREIYDDYRSTNTRSMDREDEFIDEAEQAAMRARDILRAASDRLRSKKYNNAMMLLATAQGFGSPTKSGAFSESIANAARLVGPEVLRKEQWHDARDKDVDQMGLDMADLDKALAQTRAKVMSDRRAAQQKMAIEALKIMGKEVRPQRGSSGAGLSPFGKIAQDEGFTLGTPEFNARVNQLYNEDMNQRRQAAGVDVEEEDPQQAIDLAFDFGIPIQVRDPFANMSTKQRQTALQARQREAQDRLKEIKDATASAKASIADMDRFVQLNKDVPTGPIIGRIWPNTLFSEEGQEMGSITARQSRNMRVPGEGPMSNYDARQLQLAAVSRTKGPGTNRNIAKGIKAVRGLQLEYDRFMADYYAARGHLVDADQAWNQYVEDNPIFDPTKPAGTFALNEKRKDYKTYFREQNVRRLQPGATDEEIQLYLQPATDDPDDRPATPAGGGVQRLWESFSQGVTPRTGFADGGQATASKRLDRLWRDFAQGATFNFSDEALAAASDDDYESAVALERLLLEESAAEDPLLSFSAQMAGALPTSIAGVAGASALKKRLPKGKAGKAALLARLIPEGKYTKAATAGGIAGATAGLGAAQDEDATDDVLSGLVLGTAGGPLGSLLAKYGMRGYQRAKDLVTGKNMHPADRKVVEAAIADNINLRDSATQLARDQRAGIPTTLADTGGRNMQGLAENVARRGGEGAEEMIDLLEGRQTGAGERVVERVNRGLTPDNYSGKMEELKEALYTQAAPLYQKAYTDNPGVDSQVIMRLMDTKPGKRAVERALELAEVLAAKQGVPLSDIVGKINPVTGVITRPSLQFLDLTKRALDGMINAAESDMATDVGHGLRGLRTMLMDELQTPGVLKGTAWKDAREQYAGDLEVLNALKLGREKFMRMSPNELADAVKDMSYAEKDALRTGVAEALFTKLANTADTTNPGRAVIGTPGLREKLRLLFPSEAKYKEFEGALLKEIGMFERGKRIISSGRNARVAAGDDPPGQAQDLGLSAGMAALMPGADILAQPGWAARAGNILSRTLRPMSQETVDRISRTLATQDPSQAARPIDELQSAVERLQRQYESAARAGLRGAAVTGASVGPDPYGYRFAEEDDGYATGGPVVGLGDTRQTFAAPALPSAASILPAGYSGLVGTGQQRSRIQMPADMDLSRYGETGGEFQHFANNAAPDPIYRRELVPMASSSGGGGSSSSASGLGALLGGAIGLGKNVMGLKDAYEGLTGRNAVDDIKNLFGYGTFDYRNNLADLAANSVDGFAPGQNVPQYDNLVGNPNNWGGSAGLGTIGSLGGLSYLGGAAGSPLGSVTAEMLDDVVLGGGSSLAHIGTGAIDDAVGAGYQSASSALGGGAGGAASKLSGMFNPINIAGAVGAGLLGNAIAGDSKYGQLLSNVGSLAGTALSSGSGIALGSQLGAAAGPVGALAGAALGAVAGKGIQKLLGKDVKQDLMSFNQQTGQWEYNDLSDRFTQGWGDDKKNAFLKEFNDYLETGQVGSMLKGSMSGRFENAYKASKKIREQLGLKQGESLSAALTKAQQSAPASASQKAAERAALKQAGYSDAQIAALGYSKGGKVIRESRQYV